MRREALLRLGLCLELGLLLLIRGVHPAFAHAELMSAYPAPGAELTASPTEIHLTFSEPLKSESMLVVFGIGFREVRGISTTLNPQSPEQLSAALPALDPDTYTVQWKAVSADGHQVSGSYSFSVVAHAVESGGGGFWVWAATGVLAIVFLIALVWRRRRSAMG